MIEPIAKLCVSRVGSAGAVGDTAEWQVHTYSDLRPPVVFYKLFTWRGTLLYWLDHLMSFALVALAVLSFLYAWNQLPDK